MKVCILGSGLTSLTLAKTLANIGINVDIFSNVINQKYNKIRTIGISKSNLEFFNKNILNLESILWDINKIEIYSEILNNEKILKFENQNQKLFSTIKNHQLIDHLFSSLKKNKFINFKKKFNLNLSKKNNYKLIFNCEQNNLLSKISIFISRLVKLFANARLVNPSPNIPTFIIILILTIKIR